MLKLKKDSRYADAIERTLYNALLSGISLSGDAFFYVNPLELNIRKLNRHQFGVQPQGKRKIIPERAKTFNCFCCPPNVNRLLAKVDEYVYMEEDSGVYVNLFADSVFDSGNCHIEQKTKYPENGKVTFSCSNINKLYIRIPHWCEQPEFDHEYTVENGYAVFENPKEISVDFHMQPKFYHANTHVRDNYGKVALMNGPVVYCIEGVDNGDIYSLTVDTSSEMEIMYNEEFSMNEIIVSGTRHPQTTELYSSHKVNAEKAKIKFVPYSVFANRGVTDMLVWVVAE